MNASDGVVIPVLTEDHIVCGRGGYAATHIGNLKFLTYVDEQYPKYVAIATKIEKTEFSTQIVQEIYQRNGQFVEKDAATGHWKVVPLAIARRKVAQALRDTPIREKKRQQPQQQKGGEEKMEKQRKRIQPQPQPQPPVVEVMAPATISPRPLQQEISSSSSIVQQEISSSSSTTTQPHEDTVLVAKGNIQYIQYNTYQNQTMVWKDNITLSLVKRRSDETKTLLIQKETPVAATSSPTRTVSSGSHHSGTLTIGSGDTTTPTELETLQDLPLTCMDDVFLSMNNNQFVIQLNCATGTTMMSFHTYTMDEARNWVAILSLHVTTTPNSPPPNDETNHPIQNYSVPMARCQPTTSYEDDTAMAWGANNLRLSGNSGTSNHRLSGNSSIVSLSDSDILDFAATAGDADDVNDSYNTDTLVSFSEGALDFLDTWIEGAGANNRNANPNAKDNTEMYINMDVMDVDDYGDYLDEFGTMALPPTTTIMDMDNIDIDELDNLDLDEMDMFDDYFYDESLDTTANEEIYRSAFSCDDDTTANRIRQYYRHSMIRMMCILQNKSKDDKDVNETDTYEKQQKKLLYLLLQKQQKQKIQQQRSKQQTSKRQPPPKLNSKSNPKSSAGEDKSTAVQRDIKCESSTPTHTTASNHNTNNTTILGSIYNKVIHGIVMEKMIVPVQLTLYNNVFDVPTRTYTINRILNEQTSLVTTQLHIAFQRIEYYCMLFINKIISFVQQLRR